MSLDLSFTLLLPHQLQTLLQLINQTVLVSQMTLGTFLTSLKLIPNDLQVPFQSFLLLAELNDLFLRLFPGRVNSTDQIAAPVSNTSLQRQPTLPLP